MGPKELDRTRQLTQRRKWQPTPVFLPGESQGQGSLVGCHLWGLTQSWTRLKQHSSSSSNTYIWNLERWYWWTYLQGSNADADIEKTCGHSWGRRGLGQIERVAWKHIHLTDSKWGICCMTQGSQTSALCQTRGVGWEVGGRLKRMGTYLPLGCWCTAENNTIV